MIVAGVLAKLLAENIGVHVADIRVTVGRYFLSIVEARSGNEAGRAQVREYVVHRTIGDLPFANLKRGRLREAA